MRYLIAISTGWAFIINVVFAQAPKYSNDFLSVGVGARSLAMANASVASVEDVTSGYWNPAGLLNGMANIEAGLMHSEYFAGIAKYDYAGAVKKMNDSSAIAISVIRFGVDNIQNTTELIDPDGNIDYSRISYFSAADYAFIFSYARKLKKEGLQIGGNAKIIYRKIGKFASAWGFGIDAGLQYRMKKWRFGAVIRDVTSTFNAWSFNSGALEIEVLDSIYNQAPSNSLELTLPRLILGASRLFPIKGKFSALAEINTDITFDGKRNVLVRGNPVSIEPHLGVEVNYNHLVFLRLGLGNIQKEADFENKISYTVQPNLGMGVKIKRLAIDYALTDIGDQSIALYSNIFSLKYAFE